uniref:Glucan endo-1,3-alpha-glucosidase agn1 n=1 Tax=Talaromyces marneffei PM1 TaxID=1077442 RepID=A0A093V1L1_TALMA
MKQTTSLLLSAIAATSSFSGLTAAQKLAFAHVVVGNTAAHTQSTWESDITLAHNSGLDAFALNGGFPDGNIPAQIANAFAACEALSNGFKLFISFDYLGGGQPWPASEVVSMLKQYASSDCYLAYDGKPFVSTFEGTGNIADWAHGGPIRSAVDVYFVPDWTSLGPAGIKSYLDNIDGFFSWNMWPVGAADMTDEPDFEWLDAIGSDKTYMMGVSPWFFHSASGGTDWVWRGDDLWDDRWIQVTCVDPQFVQVVTWNDWGESSYIGPFVTASEVPAGSLAYVDNMSHQSFLDFLPFYIAIFKGDTFNISRDQMQYWYRLAPAAAGSACGVYGNDPDQGQTTVDVNSIVQDKVFFSALLTADATVTVQIGSNAAVSYDGVAGMNHWSQDFNGQTGAVTFSVVRGGATVKSGIGAEITASTSLSNGCTNYNPWLYV